MNKTDQIYTARQLSDRVFGELVGDPELKIIGLSAIDQDKANTITFFGNPRYERHIEGKEQRIIIVPIDFIPKDVGQNTFIKVDNVYDAVAALSSLFDTSTNGHKVEISKNSIIEKDAALGSNVSVGHYSIIGANCTIGDSVVIHEQVNIQEGVSIGKGSIIHTGVKIMRGVSIGERCIIYPNAVIGSDGFGHAWSTNGYKKIVHHGSVIIEDDVEIGSNTCIDRGAISDTIIKRGSKLDNLIQVAHGVEIGEDVAMAAQSGISGSSKIGNKCQIGGQAGIIGHISVAPQSKIQGKSGVAGSITVPDKKWYGYPAISYYEYLRSYAIFKRLPDLQSRLRQLEKGSEDDNV